MENEVKISYFEIKNLQSAISNSFLDFIFERVKLALYCNTEVCYGKKISL